MIEEIGKEIFEEYGYITAILIILGVFTIVYVVKKVIPMWISIAVEEEKRNNSKSIEKLKSELDKHKQELEHIHQVSQPTYQKLFDKKIEIYQTMIKMISDYERKEAEDTAFIEVTGSIENSESLYLYKDLLIDILRLIKNNHLFISTELYSISNGLEITLKPLRTELVEHHILMNSVATEDESFELKNQDNLLNDEIVEKTKEDWKKFQKYLKKDIVKIKAKINLD